MEEKVKNNLEGVLDTLHRLVVEVAADPDLTLPRDTFASMQLDALELNSLESVELSLKIEDELGTDIELKPSPGLTFSDLAGIILSQIK